MSCLRVALPLKANSVHCTLLGEIVGEHGL